jgi:hypothetical protein
MDRRFQINFILYQGSCLDMGQVNYRVYQNIADASGGSIFLVQPDMAGGQLNQVFVYMTYLTNQHHVYVDQSRRVGGASYMIRVPVDTRLKHVLFYVHGCDVDAQLRDNTGRVQSKLQQFSCLAVCREVDGDGE